MTAAPKNRHFHVVALAIAKALAEADRYPGVSKIQMVENAAQAALDACHAEEMQVVLEIMHGGMLCLHSIAPEDMKAKMQEYADVALALLVKLDGKP